MPFERLGTPRDPPSLALYVETDKGADPELIVVDPYRFRGRFEASRQERQELDAKMARMADELGTAQAQVADLERRLHALLHPRRPAEKRTAWEPTLATGLVRR